MKTVFSAVCFIATLAATIQTASAAQINGRYVGTIFSNFDLNGATMFKTSANGVITATYRFGQNERGRLTDCTLRGQRLKCTWRDQYGSGRFSVVFSPDFSTFAGGWYDPQGLGPYLWNGRKR